MHDSHAAGHSTVSLSGIGLTAEDGSALMKLFRTAERINASDIHMMMGATPYFRLPGKFASFKGDGLRDGEVDAIMSFTLNDERRAIYRKQGYVDYSHEEMVPIEDGKQKRVRYRIQLYQSRGSMAAAIRRIKLELPTFESLHLPPVYEVAITMRPKGIIVIGGETGSGKSTTLAAMLHYINQREMKHIVTIEDPIEFVIENDKSRINQRELGEDFPTYAEALRAVVRQDPDVIVIGEMRDADTVRTAIIAAETGHLVLTSLHTAEAFQTFNRIPQLLQRDRKRSDSAEPQHHADRHYEPDAAPLHGPNDPPGAGDRGADQYGRRKNVYRARRGEQTGGHRRRRRGRDAELQYVVTGTVQRKPDRPPHGPPCVAPSGTATDDAGFRRRPEVDGLEEVIHRRSRGSALMRRAGPPCRLPEVADATHRESVLPSLSFSPVWSAL